MSAKPDSAKWINEKTNASDKGSQDCPALPLTHTEMASVREARKRMAGAAERRKEPEAEPTTFYNASKSG